MVPSEAVRDAAKQVVGMLVNGEFAQLVELSRGRRLPADQIEGAIVEYGRTLRMPPDPLELDAVLVTGSTPPKWHIEIDLWTLEQGRSDLTLSMWITDSAGEADIELLDIHVL